MKHKYIKRIILFFWLSVLITFWTYALFNPSIISAKNISNFILKFETHLLIVYAIMFILRPFVMVPGATFVIVGAMIFETRLELILLISVFCELASSSIVYFFSDYMGFDKFFKKRYPKKLEKFKNKLESKSGFLFILFWCSFPFVPSDLIFYLSGSLRISYKKFILAVFLGHVVLYSIYIFFTDTFFGNLI